MDNEQGPSLKLMASFKIEFLFISAPSNIPLAGELATGCIPTGLGLWRHKRKGNCLQVRDHSLMHPVHMQIFWIKLTALCPAQMMQAAWQDSHPDASFLVSFLFISLPLLLRAEDCNILCSALNANS